MQNGRVESKKMRQPAFPRGPPPQYYLVSIQLNFAVRMGSGGGMACDRRRSMRQFRVSCFARAGAAAALPSSWGVTLHAALFKRWRRRAPHAS
jgi:hypothetical protein